MLEIGEYRYVSDEYERLCVLYLSDEKERLCVCCKLISDQLSPFFSHRPPPFPFYLVRILILNPDPDPDPDPDDPDLHPKSSS